MTEKQLVLLKLKEKMNPNEFESIANNYDFIRENLFADFILLDQIKDIVGLIFDAKQYVLKKISEQNKKRL